MKSRTFQIGATVFGLVVSWLVIGRIITLCWLLMHPPVKGWFDTRLAELAPFTNGNGMIYIPGTSRNDAISSLIGGSVPRPTFAHINTDLVTWGVCYAATAMILLFFIALIRTKPQQNH